VNHNTARTGECMYEDFRLEYQVVNLEYIKDRSLKIEAVCYNPYNILDKEAIFKHSTNNLNVFDERLKISYSIIDSLIANLDLPKNKLYKLIIRDNQVFYICKV
jgi:NhaP-type Na+/H+ and K+/H+ antiporter